MNLISELTAPPSGPSRIIRGAPLYEQVQEALWQQVLQGAIEPGQHLSDRSIAEQLAVSRTPVREAMRQMARDGILETLGNGGYRVTSVDRAGLLDLYVCRAALAAAAVEEASRRGDKALCAELHGVLADKRAALDARDVPAVFRGSSAFHDRIIESSTNRFLRDTMASLGRLILFYRFTLLRRSLDLEGVRDAYLRHFEESHVRHEAILSAMAAGAHDTAADLMRENLRQTSRDMDEILGLVEG